MYLREFTKEEQRAFLKLVYVMIFADKKLAKEEFDIFQGYSVEIGETIAFEDVKINVLDELKILRNLPTDKKRKIYFELLAVAKIDNEFTEAEKDLMSTVQKELAINDMETKELAISLDEVKTAYQKLNAVIHR